jgi:hypothetical protein
VRVGHRHRRIVPQEEARQIVKRALTLRNVAKGAGTVVLGLIALDVLATIVTLAIGSEFLKK